MTAQEKRVKKYIDAWCDGKRVEILSNDSGKWFEVQTLRYLLYLLYQGDYKLRIVKGKRG